MMMENGARGLRKLFISVIGGVILSYDGQDGSAEMSISHVAADDNRVGILRFWFIPAQAGLIG
jgi:hypothetical protein